MPFWPHFSTLCAADTTKSGLGFEDHVGRPLPKRYPIQGHVRVSTTIRPRCGHDVVITEPGRTTRTIPGPEVRQIVELELVTLI